MFTKPFVQKQREQLGIACPARRRDVCLGGELKSPITGVADHIVSLIDENTPQFGILFACGKTPRDGGHINTCVDLLPIAQTAQNNRERCGFIDRLNAVPAGG